MLMSLVNMLPAKNLTHVGDGEVVVSNVFGIPVLSWESHHAEFTYLEVPSVTLFLPSAPEKNSLH